MKTTLFILFQKLVPQHIISRLVGWLATSECKHIKTLFIRWFKWKYQVDMSQALEQDPFAYKSFNDFFTRALKPDARPFDKEKAAIISPADGAVSQAGKIDYDRVFQAKGKSFSLKALLGGSEQWASTFQNGSFATVYLSPKDYHRVHMPVDGTLLETVYVPGDLYSVNQATAANIDELFARNERLVCFFNTEHGPMAMILVGAMIVAGIETVWSGQVAPVPKQPIHTPFATETLDQPIHLNKGDEMGRFMLGSTVILVFPEQAEIAWDKEVFAGAPLKLGQTVATYTQTQHS
ncbi:MAG: archaetidylserine decarboxylase [Pontibacterium sp.]